METTKLGQWTLRTPAGGNTYYEILGKDCSITIQPRPSYCDRGNWLAAIWVLGGTKLSLDMDHQDLWPRYYMDLDRAKLECESWLKKRGQL